MTPFYKVHISLAFASVAVTDIQEEVGAHFLTDAIYSVFIRGANLAIICFATKIDTAPFSANLP